jgi:heptaprenyl diphosphate synthase
MATSGGTFLFARAIALLASLGDEVNLLTSRATVRLCAGQLLEVENAYNTDLSVAEHTEILARKTATLFELPCVLGAKLAGADPSQVAALVAYAHKLGLAFQIADDALDVAGDASVLGKTTLTDLREGIYSLPLILVLQQQVPGCAGETVRLRGILRQARLSESDLQEIVAALRRLGAVDMALEQARAYAREASDGLRELPYGPACESLALLADFAVSRSC